MYQAIVVTKPSAFLAPAARTAIGARTRLLPSGPALRG